mgnify:CR=1 FL=1
MIKSGSIEYFELLTFRDKLKSFRLNKLDLNYLDKLRMEVDLKIEEIHLEAKEKQKSSD